MSDKKEETSGVKIDNRVVVSGAMMRCSFSQDERTDGSDYRELIIPDDEYYTKIDKSKYETVQVQQGRGNRSYDEIHHKLTEDLSNFNPRATVCGGPGGAAAHTLHCVPVENVPLFSYCKSPYYIETLDAIGALLQKKIDDLGALKQDNETWDERKALNHQRIDFVSKRMTAYHQKEERYSKECVGLYLDRWFNLNAELTKATVDSFMRINDELRAELVSARKKLKVDLQVVENKASNYFRESHIRKAPANRDPQEEPLWQVKEYKEHADALLNTLDQLILTLVPDLLEQTSNDYQEIVENGTPVALSASITMQIAEIIAYVERVNAGSSFEGWESFEDWKSKWPLLNQRVIELAALKLQCEKSRNEIEQLNMDSYLVCRCGGIISFVHSGQYMLHRTVNFNKMMVGAFTIIQNDCEKRFEANKKFLLQDEEELQQIPTNNKSYADLERGRVEKTARAADYFNGYTYAHNVVNLFKGVQGQDWETENIVVLVQLGQQKDALEKEVKGEAMKTFYTTAALATISAANPAVGATVGLVFRTGQAVSGNGIDGVGIANDMKTRYMVGVEQPKLTNNASWTQYGAGKAIGVVSDTKTVSDLVTSFLTMAFYTAKDPFMARLNLAVCGFGTEIYYAIDVDQLGNICGFAVSEEKKSYTSLSWNSSTIVEQNNLALLFNCKMMMDSTGKQFEFETNYAVGRE